jgi:GT2 family glycosyltransferase
VNLSGSRLRHLFKAEIGTTPSQYLKRLRLERARTQVATTFLSVKEIMAEVGLADESHFVRDFQRAFGMSPRQYRAVHRQGWHDTAGTKSRADRLRATVVISSLNEGARLWKTVGSSLETTTDLACEVLVADDHSTDTSLDDVRHRYPGVRIVAHPERRGVASTKDLGARSAQGAVLVFLDGHCKPEPGAIERLVSDVERLDGRAVVTPAVSALNTDCWENGAHVGTGYCLELTEFKGGWCDHAGLRRRGTFYETPALMGCCLAMSRDLYKELRGFDTGMHEWGSEDLDFGLRAWFLGSGVLNDPDAIVGHRFRTSFDNFQVGAVHPLVNQLRMARRNFEDANWDAWLMACRERYKSWPDFWSSVWTTFEQGRDSVENDRRYVLDHKTRDEYWFADYFNLPWPRRHQG